MSEHESQTPHSTEPAEGDVAPGQDDSGRTPHTDEPAEGSEAAAEAGVDPENRISGA